MMRRVPATTLMLLAVLVPWVVYIFAVFLRGTAAAEPLATVRCFDPDMVLTVGRIASAAGMAVGACGMLFGGPWLLGIVLFCSSSGTRSAAHAWSLAVNTVALMLVCLILRWSVGISRPSFLVGWLVWTTSLSAVACCWGDPSRELQHLRRTYGQAFLIGLVAVTTGAVLLSPEHFLQCFNGDGTESYELARSLRGHFLPTWHLEESYDRRFAAVVVYPALISSYWNFGLQTLLGKGEVASRVAYWVYWLGIVLVALRMQSQGGRSRCFGTICILLTAWILTAWYSFYMGGAMSDLAYPGVPDLLFTLFVLIGFDCLRRGNEWGWIVTVMLSSLVLYAGPVMFVLTSLAALICQPIDRQRVIRAVIAGGACLAGILLLYVAWGLKEGIVLDWWRTIRAEYLADYFAVGPRSHPDPALLFLGYFVLGCGGLPALGLLCALLRSAWERMTALVLLAFLAIVLCSTEKELHYLCPMIVPSVLLWIRVIAEKEQTERRARFRWMHRALCWSSIASMCVCVALFRPISRPIFTLNRQLGQMTTFQTDSYEMATGWAAIEGPLLKQGILSWRPGSHTWVAYSELDATPTTHRPIVVNRGSPPSTAYRLLAESSQGRLYVSEEETAEWLSTRQPPRALDRFPIVFSPLFNPRSADDK